MRSLFGSGDYAEEFKAAPGFDVNDNSIVKPTSAANVPLLNSENVGKDGYMRVKHREYIGDLVAGTTVDPPNGYYGTFRYFSITPQNPALFPWLSTIAGNFEQWIPHGIVFEFISTCGNAVSSTNAALGSLSMATQYNSLSGVFKNKTEMLNHYFAVSGKTADNLMHAIECNPEEVQVPIYNTFDNNAKPISGDDRLYTLGRLEALAVGSQSAYTIGELWITYDISLLKPRIKRTFLGGDIEPNGAELAEAELKCGTSEGEIIYPYALALAKERDAEQHALEELVHHEPDIDEEDHWVQPGKPTPPINIRHRFMSASM